MNKIRHITNLSGLNPLTNELRLSLKYAESIKDSTVDITEVLECLISDKSTISKAYDRLISTVKSFSANQESCDV